MTKIPSQNKDGVWIVIAAYNEASVISVVIKNLKQFYSNIIVVDDCSYDDTESIAFNAGAIVLRHVVNLGQGASIQTGISFALMEDAKLIVTFDADGQHRVEDIEVLIKKHRQTGADVVVGSRFLGAAINMPHSRYLLLKAAILYTKLTTGLKLTDVHNGLRLLTRKAALEIEIKQNRMAHASEILNLISKNNLKIIEAPVTILYTKYSINKGQSFFNLFNIILDLFFGRMFK